MFLPCTTDDREHQELIVKHALDVLCDNAAVERFVEILDNHVKFLVGEWPGVVNVRQDSCQDDGTKRSDTSTVESTVILDGPYADLTASAITNTMDPVLIYDEGVTATLISSTPAEEAGTDGDGDGISGGAIAGIVIGIAFAFILVLGAVASTFHTSTPVPERV